jgi:DNA-binding response OmpR family regulator
MALQEDAALASELHVRSWWIVSSMAKQHINVLVVEDEKLLNWSLAESLSKWGFEVRPVFTGNEAVAQVENSWFDVVLLDYHLPDVDGLAIARRVRTVQPNAVIFLVTAFQLNELTVDSGLIDAYFNKPLDLQQLHQALKKVPKWHASGARGAAPTQRPRRA